MHSLTSIIIIVSEKITTLKFSPHTICWQAGLALIITYAHFFHVTVSEKHSFKRGVEVWMEVRIHTQFTACRHSQNPGSEPPENKQTNNSPKENNNRTSPKIHCIQTFELLLWPLCVCVRVCMYVCVCVCVCVCVMCVCFLSSPWNHWISEC